MAKPATRVAILGSTGSIGRSALDVVAGLPGRLEATLLAACTSTELVEEQAAKCRPKWVVVTDEAAARNHRWTKLPPGTRLIAGSKELERLVADAEVDVVLSAIVGSAGLRSTWAALEAGKPVALANKETLVMAGPLVTELARRKRAPLIPVDSEHSAIFQALQAGNRSELKRIILTASGGPFRNHTVEQLAGVTVDEALAHPNWRMGPKITVDSATMMNKALEIIEARWLFDLQAEQIQVMIHPQSVVHSMVEFLDGAVVAQLSPPDMRLPIQYALTYPDRVEGVAATVDWTASHQWTFEPADLERFPALELGYEAARAGGTTGAVLNAANEAAAAGFLSGELKFTEIVPTCRSVLANHAYEASPSLERLAELDRWARQEVTRWACL
jgi:1-deoxy-D-xylulose-5-phosphate reductoisomerase